MFKIWVIALMSVHLYSQAFASAAPQVLDKEESGGKTLVSASSSSAVTDLSTSSAAAAVTSTTGGLPQALKILELLRVPSSSAVDRSSSVSPPPLSPLSSCSEFHATVGQCNPYAPSNGAGVVHSQTSFFFSSASEKTYGCGGTELAVGMDPDDSACNSLTSSVASLRPFSPPLSPPSSQGGEKKKKYDDEDKK